MEYLRIFLLLFVALLTQYAASFSFSVSLSLALFSLSDEFYLMYL